MGSVLSLLAQGHFLYSFVREFLGPWENSPSPVIHSLSEAVKQVVFLWGEHIIQFWSINLPSLGIVNKVVKQSDTEATSCWQLEETLLQIPLLVFPRPAVPLSFQVCHPVASQ